MNMQLFFGLSARLQTVSYVWKNMQLLDILSIFFFDSGVSVENQRLNTV